MNASREVESAAVSLQRVSLLSFSGTGMLFASLFFGLSLEPSLLPRGPLFQGIVSGITLIIGYGIGVFLQWAWHYVGLRMPERVSALHRVNVLVAVATIGLFTLLSIWRHVGWQNDVRTIFGENSISPVVWLVIIPLTLAVSGLILFIGRSLRKLVRWVAYWLGKVMSQRVARLIGWIAVVLLVLLLVNGVLIDGFFTAANRAFAVRDTETEEGVN